jgi:hypothetical protein
MLAATLGLKALWTRASSDGDPALFNREAAAMLHAGGFAEVASDGHFLEARGGACRLLLADYMLDGTLSEALTVAAQPVGPIRYVARGRISEHLFKPGALLAFYAERELRRTGFSHERHPIVAVAASPGCALDRLDWRRLASLPR